MMHFSKEFSVKFSRLSAVSVMAVAMSCALTACSSGDDASTGKSASATSQAGSQAAKIAMPTPEDLNADGAEWGVGVRPVSGDDEAAG